MPADDLDLLAETTEVAPQRTRPLAVIGALALGAGVATLAVVVLAHVFTADQEAAPPRDRVLTVAEIEQLTALDLPEGAEVVDAEYTEGGDAVEVDATIALPADAGDPFLDSVYYAIDEPTRDWPGFDGAVFYEATGEFGALNAEGAFVPGSLGIHLRRDL